MSPLLLVWSLHTVSAPVLQRTVTLLSASAVAGARLLLRLRRVFGSRSRFHRQMSVAPLAGVER